MDKIYVNRKARNIFFLTQIFYEYIMDAVFSQFPGTIIHKKEVNANVDDISAEEKAEK